MIRAAALSYAIVFSLLIALICSGVLFIASTQKRIEVIHNNKERVLFDSYSAIGFSEHNLPVGDSSILIHENGDTSEVKHTIWGAFSLVNAHTHNGTYFKSRSALIGTIHESTLPCLYIPSNSGGLKITGDTRLEGSVFIPNGEIERAFIGGKSYVYDELVFGKVNTATTTLPSLNTIWSNVLPTDITLNSSARDYLPKDSTYQFDNPTVYFQSVLPLRIEHKIRGNAIIHSFDSVVVSAEASLENVIIISPIVRFEKGFKGRVQVLAHQRIVCEEGVQLLYPSVCILNELTIRNENERTGIYLDSNAMVLGGILITSQRLDFRKPPLLKIKPSSLIAGLIYTVGESELTGGKVIGNLYTQQLVSQVGGGVYGNHLVDVWISSTRLPNYFLLPNWLDNQETQRNKIICWL